MRKKSASSKPVSNKSDSQTGAHSRTPLLDAAASPQELRALEEKDLPALAAELRAETIAAVSQTGGHLGAGLGVVELTVALHYVFNTPKDILVWDVGHQCYPHKILTARRDRIRTLRQKGGLSGFTQRDESPYDPFGAAHASTSISAGLGFAVARDLEGGEDGRRVICVIGDGAMSAGMAYEAMNNAGALGSRLIVILNDNDMSIAPPVGAMSAYLSRLLSSRSYLSTRLASRSLAARFPRPLARAARRAEEYARGMLTGGTLFEELGFFYVGPVDGHNLAHLLPLLRNLQKAHDRYGHKGGPFLLHVVTRKGKGYAPAEAAPDKSHAVSAGFDKVPSPAQAKKHAQKAKPPSWTQTFSAALIAAARRDKRIVAVTAAMPSGTGLDAFAEQFPQRCFDVGIAEQHGVTFCAGLAAAGYKPFAAIYSTFLQRGYDQVVHDVAIQGLPVRFVLDRAGLVGADGCTHHGSFDLAYLSCLPGFVVMAPADKRDLQRMVQWQADYDSGPSAVRFPRGAAEVEDYGGDFTDVFGESASEAGGFIDMAGGGDCGRGRVVRAARGGVAILSLGALLGEALAAAEILEKAGVGCSVADARFAKPLDEVLLRWLAGRHRLLATLEDGAAGGFGARVFHWMAAAGLPVQLLPLALPDKFIAHATREEQLAEAGLDAPAIAERIQSRLDAMAGR